MADGRRTRHARAHSRRGLKVETSRIDERGMATRIGKAMHRLGYEKVEDKSIPERF
jgi:hypothetical protein